MSVVLIHGNPETDAIWGPIRTELARDDVICLSPPGFGTPLPPDFDVTSDGYLNWLIGELEDLDGPIDLVGHDWGGGHVVRLAMTRPDLIRSWCSDVIGIFNHEYEWHDAAQSWQGPDGENAVRSMVELPESDRAAMFAQLGMGESVAAKVSPWTTVFSRPSTPSRKISDTSSNPRRIASNPARHGTPRPSSSDWPSRKAPPGRPVMWKTRPVSREVISTNAGVWRLVSPKPGISAAQVVDIPCWPKMTRS